MTAAPATRLDVARARRLTDQLAGALSLSLDLLGQAFDGRAWEVLDYPSWDAYCAAELPALAQLRLPLDERRAAVAELRARGFSVRAIAAPLGLGVGTVARDLEHAPKLATVTSLDGRQRPATAAPAPRRRARPLVDRVVELVAAAGPEGLDVFAVTAQLRGARQSQVGPALHRLAAAGRLTYLAPERRGRTGRYVVAGT